MCLLCRMVCKRLTLKKYKSRPGPPYHAGDCKGAKKKGNDGETYVSVVQGDGSYRWMKQASQPTRKAKKGVKVYVTRDNGNAPFRIEDDGKSVVVFRQTYDEKTDGYVVGKQVYATPYKALWVGTDKLKLAPMYSAALQRGNTVLLQKSASIFTFIGERIIEFQLQPGDAPVLYQSNLGNSDVPYPYLIGKTHTYFFIEDSVVPNEWLDLKGDGYAQLYGHVAAPKGSVKSRVKKLKYKTVEKRDF
jgi:hypothetical protein